MKDIGSAYLLLLALVLSVPLQVWSKSKPASTDEAEAAGSKRETYFELLTLYGAGDAASLAKANRILESLLPRTQPQLAAKPQGWFAGDSASRGGQARRSAHVFGVVSLVVGSATAWRAMDAVSPGGRGKSSMAKAMSLLPDTRSLSVPRRKPSGGWW